MFPQLPWLTPWKKLASVNANQVGTTAELLLVHGSKNFRISITQLRNLVSRDDVGGIPIGDVEGLLAELAGKAGISGEGINASAFRTALGISTLNIVDAISVANQAARLALSADVARNALVKESDTGVSYMLISGGNPATSGDWLKIADVTIEIDDIPGLAAVLSSIVTGDGTGITDPASFRAILQVPQAGVDGRILEEALPETIPAEALVLADTSAAVPALRVLGSVNQELTFGNGIDAGGVPIRSAPRRFAGPAALQPWQLVNQIITVPCRTTDFAGAGAGNIEVTLTSAAFGSPITTTVEVAAGDLGDQIASKVCTAMRANSTIMAEFEITRCAKFVQIQRRTTATTDPTLACTLAATTATNVTAVTTASSAAYRLLELGRFPILASEAVDGKKWMIRGNMEVFGPPGYSPATQMSIGIRPASAPSPAVNATGGNYTLMVLNSGSVLQCQYDLIAPLKFTTVSGALQVRSSDAETVTCLRGQRRVMAPTTFLTESVTYNPLSESLALQTFGPMMKTDLVVDLRLPVVSSAVLVNPLYVSSFFELFEGNW